MISSLIDGKDIAEFDDEITDKFNLLSGSIKSIRNERMQVAIRNGNGDIYRAIGVTGLDQFLSIIQHLTGIGLVDELKDESVSRHGYDAIFGA